MDELIKVLITQAPNFIGFIVLTFVLVKYVIMPGITLIGTLNETIKAMAFKFAECDERDEKEPTS